MADRRVARKPLILIAIVTVLAGVLFYLFGAYGVVGAGVLGICATFGIQWTGAHFISYPHLARLSWRKVEPTDGKGGQSWVWTAVEGGYSFALIALGLMLASSLERPPSYLPNSGESAEHRESASAWEKEWHL